MANFWSGFNQGFQPYGTRAADLISRTILNNRQYERESQDKQKLAEKKALEAKLLDEQQNQIYEQGLKGDFTNYRNLISEKRVALNQELARAEPKKLYQREDIPGKGKVWHEVTVPKDGEPTFRELSVTPTEAKKTKKIINGKELTYVTYSDGKTMVTEEKPAPKSSEVKRSRRELFNDPKTDVTSFMNEYRGDINALAVEKNRVADIYDLEGESTAFSNAKAKYELKKIKTTESLLDLFQDQKLSNVFSQLSSKSDKAWDVVIENIVEKYLDEGLDDSEERTIQLIHNLYVAQHGKPSESLTQYIQ